MKLDYDAIRHILITIEESDNRLTVADFCNDIYNENVISYHIALLLDVDYIEASPVRTIGSNFTDYRIKRMTMQGHQYLDSIRDNKIWQTTKETIQKTTSSISLDIIKSVALKIAMNLLGI